MIKTYETRTKGNPKLEIKSKKVRTLNQYLRSEEMEEETTEEDEGAGPPPPLA